MKTNEEEKLHRYLLAITARRRDGRDPAVHERHNDQPDNRHALPTHAKNRSAKAGRWPAVGKAVAGWCDAKGGQLCRLIRTLLHCSENDEYCCTHVLSERRETRRTHAENTDEISNWCR